MRAVAVCALAAWMAGAVMGGLAAPEPRARARAEEADVKKGEAPTRLPSEAPRLEVILSELQCGIKGLPCL